MDKDEVIKTLRAYESELDDILDRFKRTRDGIHIDHADDPRFRQLVIELRDCLNDTLGNKNTYSTMIVNFFNDGITNFTGSPSYKSVENIRGVVSSVVTRVKRNPELISRANSNTAQKDTSLQKEPELPSKVTLSWLVKHVPVSFWITSVSLLAASFILGVHASQISLVKEIFGLEAPPQVLQQTMRAPRPLNGAVKR